MVSFCIIIMKPELLKTASELVTEYSKLLLDVQTFSFGLGSVREIFGQRTIDKHREKSEKLAKQYADYIKMYNEWLLSQKRHTPAIHNMKHQFDIVSSMKAQVSALLGDREQKANLYMGGYFNTITIIIAILAIIVALVFGVMI